MPLSFARARRIETFTERRSSRKARTTRSSQSGQGESSPWRIRNHLPGRVTRPLGKQYQQSLSSRRRTAASLCQAEASRSSHGGPHLHVPDLGVEAELLAGHHVPADCGVTRCREPVVAASHLTWRAIAFVVLLGTLLLVSPQGLPSSIKDGVSYCVWAADRCPLYIRAESTPTGMGIHETHDI